MIEINNDEKELYQRMQAAKLLLKHCHDKNEKIALCNYIANIYEAIKSISDKKLCIKKRDVFGSNKYYKKFNRHLIQLENEMLDSFMENKNFHLKYMSDLSIGVEKSFLTDIDYNVGHYTELSMDDFSDIFYQFMKSINLDDFLEEYLKNSNIYSYGISSNTMGSTLYNPVNGNVDIMIGDFIPDVHALFTLAHEMGHAYDISLFDEDIKKYNRYFYQSFNGEVYSKLFERLFLDFMINNNILKEEAQDKLLDLEDDNHNYLLTCYILSLLDNKYIYDASYMDLSNEDIKKEVGQYFNNDIVDFLDEICYLDLQEDFTYGYGDIISMFLKDSIEQDGFGNELVNQFLEKRSNLFNDEFFNTNGLSPECYLDLYQKELKLLKK